MNTPGLLGILVGVVCGISAILTAFWLGAKEGSAMRSFWRALLTLSVLVLSIIALLGFGLWWKARYVTGEGPTEEPNPSIIASPPSATASPLPTTPLQTPRLTSTTTPAPTTNSIPRPPSTATPSETKYLKNNALEHVADIWPYYAEFSNKTGATLSVEVLQANQWTLRELPRGGGGSLGSEAYPMRVRICACDDGVPAAPEWKINPTESGKGVSTVSFEFYIDRMGKINLRPERK